MKFQSLRFQDRALLVPLLGGQQHSLCGYAFDNIIIWRGLFDITWGRVNNNICIFFTDKTGCFMPLPPLGKFDEKTVKKCFCVMEDINHNCDISRIENIEENMLSLFKKMGCRFYEKSREYIILRNDAVLLKGDKFKHKRNLYNYYSKNFKSIFRDFVVKDTEAVLALYQEWMSERSLRYADPVYRALLSDSLKAFKEMLKHFKALNIIAKVVECNGKIRSFTSGFGLNKNLFCINFEIADLALKGLSVFTFCEFARALEPYTEINIMDDCGIESLKRSKEIWHPVRLVPSYTALFAS